MDKTSNDLTLLYFDGKDDKVEIPYTPELNAHSFTTELWVMPTGNEQGNFRTLVSTQTRKDSGYMICADTENHWQFCLTSNSGKTVHWGHAKVQPKWTHLACTYDSHTQIMCIYVDGQQYKNLQKHSFKPNYKIMLSIGAEATKNSDHNGFQGYIYEMRIWSNARTPQEIQAHMNQRLTGKENDLVGYWRFDNISEGKISDLTNNKNHGNIYGNPTYKSISLPENLSYSVPSINQDNEDIEAVNKLLERYSKGERNFNKVQLPGAKIIKANLSSSNFEFAYLAGVNLAITNLGVCNLGAAYLGYAYLGYAYLGYSYLGYANLSHANLSHADLTNANLTDADLSNANLSHADLSYADLTNAKLENVDISGTNFTGVKMSQDQKQLLGIK